MDKKIRNSIIVTNILLALIYFWAAWGLKSFDDYIGAINLCFEKFKEGYQVVCPSRFVEGGSYEGAPFIKRLIVKLVSFTLSNFTTLPTKDATNGFRLFSKKIVQEISIESKKGFTFSIELLAKAHRLNFKITELPEKLPVRKSGKSKFKYYTIFFYFKWFIYILLSNFKK